MLFSSTGGGFMGRAKPHDWARPRPRPIRPYNIRLSTRNVAPRNVWPLGGYQVAPASDMPTERHHKLSCMFVTNIIKSQ